MSKAKPTITISVIVLLLVLIIGVGIYVGFTTQSAVSFKNQCSVPACPSGYTDTGVICDDEIFLECSRGCIKEVGGHCGTYKSTIYERKTDYGYDEDDNGKSFSSPYSSRESSDKCYKYRSTVDFSVSDRNPGGWVHADSESHKITTSHGFGNILISQCSDDWSTSLVAGWKVKGKGTGATYSAIGKYLPYKSTSCGGGEAYGSIGRIDVAIQWQEANWVKDYDEKIMSCFYECAKDSDCGSKQNVGQPYCSGDRIVQDVEVPECNNYECDTDTKTETIQTCPDSCENAVCVENGDAPVIHVIGWDIIDNKCVYKSSGGGEYNSLEECEQHLIILGGTCGTVAPDFRDECCENDGYDYWDETTFSCKNYEDEDDEDENDDDEEENMFLKDGQPTILLWGLIGFGGLLFILFMVIMVALTRRKYE